MRYIRRMRWFVLVLLAGYVAWQSVIASGSLEAVTDFRERTPYFDVLLPAGRVERSEQGIILNQEPVYIDVRLPVRAKSAALELKVDSSSAPLKLGIQTGEGFNFEFSGLPAETVGEFTLYRYDALDLTYVRPGHKLRFIISAPGLVTDSVVVKQATISVKRAPASLSWWQEQFMRLWN